MLKMMILVGKASNIKFYIDFCQKEISNEDVLIKINQVHVLLWYFLVADNDSVIYCITCWK